MLDSIALLFAVQREKCVQGWFARSMQPGSRSQCDTSKQHKLFSALGAMGCCFGGVSRADHAQLVQLFAELQEQHAQLQQAHEAQAHEAQRLFTAHSVSQRLICELQPRAEALLDQLAQLRTSQQVGGRAAVGTLDPGQPAWHGWLTMPQMGAQISGQ